MSSTNRGPGRPPGKSPKTLAMEQHFWELHTQYNRSVKEIAEANGKAPSRVWEMLQGVRAELGIEESPPDDSASEPQPAPPPRRLSRRTAQSRAWDIADRRPNFALGLGANSLWVRTVVAIHEEGDGFRLHIGEQGARFRSRDDLAVLLLGHVERQDVDVNGWLATLFEHGRLIDIDSVDVGIPRGLGLIPGENARGEPLKPASVKKPASAQAPLPFKPTVVTGGLSDSGKIDPQDSGKTRIFPESDSGKIDLEDSGKTRIFPESDEFARTAAAAAKDKDILDLAAAAATESRAGDSGKIDNISGVDSGEIPAGDSRFINSKRSALATLTGELMKLAGLDRAPLPNELGAVDGWLKKGYSVDAIHGVIEAKVKQGNGKPLRTLCYFNEPMHEALGSKLRPEAVPQQAPASPAAAQPEPEIEEPILGSEPLDQWARVDRVVRDAIGKPVHNAWMRTACFGGIDGGEVTIKFPHEFTRDHVRQHFELHLLRAWQAENPEIRRVEMVVESARRDGPG
jgi:hypothetical protein